MSQVVKAGKRKEHVAVCVVELKASADGGAEDAFLLVQRPAQGLLAGDSTLTVTDLIVYATKARCMCSNSELARQILSMSALCS